MAEKHGMDVWNVWKSGKNVFNLCVSSSTVSSVCSVSCSVSTVCVVLLIFMISAVSKKFSPGLRRLGG